MTFVITAIMHAQIGSARSYGRRLRSARRLWMGLFCCALSPVAAALFVLTIVERVPVPGAAGEALGVKRLPNRIITEIYRLRSNIVTKFQKVGIAEDIPITNKTERDRDLRNGGVLQNFGAEAQGGPRHAALWANNVANPIGFGCVPPGNRFVHIFRTEIASLARCPLCIAIRPSGYFRRFPTMEQPPNSGGADLGHYWHLGIRRR